MLTRRELIGSLISLGVAGPAIVRASSLMPVKVMEPLITFEWKVKWVGTYIYEIPPEMQALLQLRVNAAYEIMRKQLAENLEAELYGDHRPAGPDSFGDLFDGR